MFPYLKQLSQGKEEIHSTRSWTFKETVVCLYKTKVVGPGSKIQLICGYLVIYFATRFIHKVATSDTPFVVEYTVNVYRDFQISTGIFFFFFEIL